MATKTQRPTKSQPKRLRFKSAGARRKTKAAHQLSPARSRVWRWSPARGEYELPQ